MINQPALALTIATVRKHDVFYLLYSGNFYFRAGLTPSPTSLLCCISEGGGRITAFAHNHPVRSILPLLALQIFGFSKLSGPPRPQRDCCLLTPYSLLPPLLTFLPTRPPKCFSTTRSFPVSYLPP